MGRMNIKVQPPALPDWCVKLFPHFVVIVKADISSISGAGNACVDIKVMLAYQVELNSMCASVHARLTNHVIQVRPIRFLTSN